MKKFSLWLLGAIAIPFLSFLPVLAIGWTFHSLPFHIVGNFLAWSLPFADSDDMSVAIVTWLGICAICEGGWALYIFADFSDEKKIEKHLLSDEGSCDACGEKGRMNPVIKLSNGTCICEKCLEKMPDIIK